MQSVLNHIAIVVSDPPRSAIIFQALFGAQVNPPPSDHKGPPEFVVRMPGLSIVLIQGVVPATRSDSHIAFSVEVSDFPVLKTRLARLGLEYQEPRWGSAGRALYFTDYDNNLFELRSQPVP